MAVRICLFLAGLLTPFFSLIISVFSLLIRCSFSRFPIYKISTPRLFLRRACFQQPVVRSFFSSSARVPHSSTPPRMPEVEAAPFGIFSGVLRNELCRPEDIRCLPTMSKAGPEISIVLTFSRNPQCPSSGSKSSKRFIPSLWTFVWWQHLAQSTRRLFRDPLTPLEGEELEVIRAEVATCSLQGSSLSPGCPGRQHPWGAGPQAASRGCRAM